MNNLTVLSDKDAEVINGGLLNTSVTNYFPSVTSLSLFKSNNAFSTNTGIGLVGIGALNIAI